MTRLLSDGSGAGCSRPRCPWWRSIVPLVVATVACVAAFGPVAFAHADGCANAASRLGAADHLPECRAYEMVSPVYKGGYGTGGTAEFGILAVSPGGERLAFDSRGGFAGTPSNPTINSYLASRRASGWSTSPLDPPASIAPWSPLSNPVDYSLGLESSLSFTAPGPNARYAEESPDVKEKLFLLHDSDTADVAANFQIAGMALESLDGEHFIGLYDGASPDLCDVLFRSGPEAEAPLLPAAVGSFAKLYEMSTGAPGCAEAPALRLVALDDAGQTIDPYCPVELGSTGVATGWRINAYNAIAAEGQEIFFSTSTSLAYGKQCDGFVNAVVPRNPAVLFARLGGERTLEISTPIASDCQAGAPCASAPQARAEFQGASEDGRRAYFLTTQPLVTADTDNGTDLYLAEIGCPGGGEGCGVSERVVTALTQVSHDPQAGQAAEVQGVVAVAPDGGRVYFVARGALTSTPGPGGQAPVSGEDNLYAYDADAGTMSFVATLCSGPLRSGAGEDTSCPADLVVGQNPDSGRYENDAGLWESYFPEAQTAGQSGRFLVFASYAQLAEDADTAADIYRYDAQAGTLQRVSVGEGGYDANGNAGDSDATIQPVALNEATVTANYRLAVKTVSEDGSRIVFATAAPLSPDAVNGLSNVYEWHEGAVSLISSGQSIEPDFAPTITPSGRDIFFVTNDGLLPQDTDGQRDVYDARLGGGFPPAPAATQPCEGDACQGALMAPAPLLVPGSVSQAPGGNVPAPAPKQATKRHAKHEGHAKRRPAKRKCAKRQPKRHRGRSGKKPRRAKARCATRHGDVRKAPR